MTPKPRKPKRGRRQANAGPELYAAMSNGSGDPITLIDRNGTTLYSSPDVTRLLGYSPAEREGQQILTVAHPDELSAVRRLFDEVAARPGHAIAFDVRCRHKNGSYRILSVVAINRVEDPEVGAIVATYRDITERRSLEERAKSTERALAEREMLLEAIIDASPECMKVVTSDGALMQINRAGLEMVDARRIEDLPRNVIELVAPEHREAFRALGDRVLKGQADQLQFEIVGIKGRRIWVESQAVRLDYPGRQEPVIVAISRDITQQKQAEDALRESERLYRTLFESAPIGLGIADASGDLLAFNDAMRAPGGYSVADIRAIGNVARLYESAEDRERLLGIARRNGRLQREPVRFRRKDGSGYDALMSLEPVEIGGRRCWLAAVEDVSSQKEAEASMRQSDERYQTFFAHSTEAFWRFELSEPCPVSWPEERQLDHLYRHAYLAECNDAMAAMYGYASSEEAVGKLLGEFLGRDEPANEEAIRDLLRSGYRQVNREVREQDLRGPLRIFLRHLIGVVQNDRLLRLWGMQRDITDQRKLEDQLRQAQKMEAIGRLAGGVAHDFNNLLTAMLGSAEMLLSGLAPSDPRLEDAVDIKQAASRAAALTRQLLAFGRRQVLKPQPLNLNRVVADMQRLLRRLIPEDIELVTRSAPDLWTILADRGQLEQVLVNLIVNARDAMPDGGVIMIETGNLEVDGRFVARNPGSTVGPHAALTIRDTGGGMDAETRAHIFEPFFTTKEVGKGTGLGLATVYGIVKQSGGYIAVQSELRVGTSFQILLPRTAQQAVPEAPPPGTATETEPVKELRGGTETILIAEDEERIRISAKRILEYYGYRVLVAPDGQAALEMLDTTAVDLVVSDVVMPRMNGTELYDAIRHAGSQVRFLFTSGYVGREGRSEVILDPTVPFLPKPWTVDELVSSVREILDVKK